MHHWLLPIFSAVCGENPRHIWSPGGQPLPCCERCTGLYVAALVAVALHLWLRPSITKRFLQLHTLCLLQLGLFVFPWLPQSPVLRTVSGTLFGFGVVAFLWPAMPAGSTKLLPGASTKAYGLGMAACAAMTVIIAERGGATGAFVLMCLISAGALALAVLAAVNVVRCILTSSPTSLRFFDDLVGRVAPHTPGFEQESEEARAE